MWRQAASGGCVQALRRPPRARTALGKRASLQGSESVARGGRGAARRRPRISEVIKVGGTAQALQMPTREKGAGQAALPPLRCLSGRLHRHCSMIHRTVERRDAGLQQPCSPQRAFPSLRRWITSMCQPEMVAVSAGLPAISGRQRRVAAGGSGGRRHRTARRKRPPTRCFL